MEEKNIGESQMLSIGALVRKQETKYIYGTNTISRYVRISMIDTLNKIDAYLNSKFVSGDKDSLGRDKPFFNIVTAAVNIWYRATDIDRSQIKIVSTRIRDTVLAFLATIFLQNWMRKENFGYFLNEWGRTLARYGSAVSKFIEKDGRLIPMVIPWNRLIVDPIDFDSNPKIELLELTEAQLYQNKNYDQEIVRKLCDAMRARETVDKNKKDNRNDYIKLYEIHGLLPKSYLTGMEVDDRTFVQQMHVISYLASKERGKYDDFTLFSGEEEKDPYMISHLIKEDGQTLSIGAVQHLFEVQWMMNHTVKSIKDQLDLASKLIFQTSDPTFIGQNALTAIENGDILIHKLNEPLSQINNTSHDVTALQSFGNMWKTLANEIVGISESMKGGTAPSGTPWRAVDALLQENHSLFELMTENKGLYIEEMLRKFILPYLRKNLGHKDQILATLSAHNIQKIDQNYIINTSNNLVNKKIKDIVLNGSRVSPEQQMGMLKSTQGNIQSQLASQGGDRFFAPSEISSKTWEDIFKDLEWEVGVNVTGEDAPGKDDLQTLNTVLQTIATNPRVLFDPNAKLIFNKILSMTGAASPAEIVEAQPFIIPPTKKFTETMDYVDVPDDIKRQMEEQAGFQPSQLPPPPQKVIPQVGG